MALRLPYIEFEEGDPQATQHNLQVDHIPVEFVGWVGLLWAICYWEDGQPRMTPSLYTEFLVLARRDVPFDLVLCRDAGIELGLSELREQPGFTF